MHKIMMKEIGNGVYEIRTLEDVIRYYKFAIRTEEIIKKKVMKIKYTQNYKLKLEESNRNIETYRTQINIINTLQKRDNHEKTK